jgi:hypothetical protein
MAHLHEKNVPLPTLSQLCVSLMERIVECQSKHFAASQIEYPCEKFVASPLNTSINPQAATSPQSLDLGAKWWTLLGSNQWQKF